MIVRRNVEKFIGDAVMALARRQTAEQLLRSGDSVGAEQQLDRALRFWRSVGAVGYIAEGEALLAASA